MLTGDNTRIINVHGLLQPDRDKIEAFLQGAVYAWCKNNGKKEFSAKDFLGGVNNDWGGNPLGELYFRHTRNGKPHGYAFTRAGIDAGKILKQVLASDDRAFITRKAGRCRVYRWE